MNTKSFQELSLMYTEFPLVLHNEDYTIWEGHLSVSDSQFKIKILVPFYPSMSDASFQCTPSIKSLLQSQINNLRKCKTLLSLIYCISHIIKTKLSKVTPCDEVWNKNMVQYSHLILSELEKALPKENIVEIKENFKVIKLKYIDKDGEEHFLEFNVAPDYPKGNIKILEVDLPTEVLGLLTKVNTMANLYDLFKQCVDSLLPFWSLCKRLDETSWVVDPQKPQKRDVYRRILISEHLSVVLTFNPIDLSSYPDVKFLGSIKAVAEARQIYLQNLKVLGWTDELDVAENISQLFGIEKLPVRTSVNKTVNTEKECFICYTTSIENEEPPSKWCNNLNCSSWYHHSCLLQWLQIVVTSAEISDHISGSCPYCGEKLWCRLNKDENNVPRLD